MLWKTLSTTSESVIHRLNVAVRGQRPTFIKTFVKKGDTTDARLKEKNSFPTNHKNTNSLTSHLAGFYGLFEQVNPLHSHGGDIRMEVTQSLTTRLTVLDNRWQQFVVAHIDPLFGKKRVQQIQLLNEQNDDDEDNQTIGIPPEEKTLNRNLALAVGALGTAVLGSFVFSPLLFVSAGAVIYLSIPIFQHAYFSLVHERSVRATVIISFYIAGALLSGLFIAISVAEIIFYLSEKLVLITHDRSRQKLVSVFGQQPRTVWALVDSVEVEVPFDTLEPGMLFVVQAGQMVAADGVIQEGFASVEQHMLTGEAQPIEKGVGDPVYAATVVLTGRLVVQVDKAGEETLAAQIGDILNHTASYQQQLEDKGLQLADQSTLPLLLLSSVALRTVGSAGAVAILGSNIGFNLKIASPIAMLNFLNIASKSGVLVKDGRSLELLSAVDTVVFDKTGTLTLEQPHVAALFPVGGITEDELLIYAAAAEHRQTHPIALAIMSAAEERNLALPTIADAHYEVGYGIQVTVNGHLIRVGSERFMNQEEIPIPQEIQTLQAQSHVEGHSLVMVAIDDQLAGAIELQPTIRPEAQQVIEQLRKHNLELVIISGDQEEPTRKLAQTLGIERYFANTLPEHKATMVEQLQAEGRTVCFVGDGINDAIALKKANVSISLRGATTIATDTAQIVLMDQSLHQLVALFELGNEYSQNMQKGFVAAIAPGMLLIGGVFVLHFGIYAAIVFEIVGLLSSLSVAMLPLLEHREER
ncbi:MAG: heavy metal translocating P-type ATPase [Chloroflexota bacterium]